MIVINSKLLILNLQLCLYSSGWWATGKEGHGGNIHTVGMILRPGVYVCVGYLVQHVAKCIFQIDLLWCLSARIVRKEFPHLKPRLTKAMLWQKEKPSEVLYDLSIFQFLLFIGITCCHFEENLLKCMKL